MASNSINRVTLIGNVGREPEVRTTDAGTKVANVRLATNGGERTDWHKLVFWAALAGVVEKYVGTGDRLYIEGRIQYGSYVDGEGRRVRTTEIVCTELRLLTPRSRDEG